MADKLKELVGANVKNKEGKDVPVESFCGEGKHVGLYFSAHWCPPCRAFTPVLSEFYNKIHADKNLEIIFVSCDRDEKSFKEYYDTMPWLAMDFGEEEGRRAVMDKFSVAGIPAFIILDGATGETSVADGRSKVDKDKEGADFPWK